MHKNVTRPCCRGLKRFEKKGCPKKYWDESTGEGCTLWRIYSAPNLDEASPKKTIILEGCVDELSDYWARAITKMTESNRATTETFRNGMCEVGEDGKVYPKASQYDIALISILQPVAEIIPVLKRMAEDRSLLEAHNMKQIKGE